MRTKALCTVLIVGFGRSSRKVILLTLSTTTSILPDPFLPEIMKSASISPLSVLPSIDKGLSCIDALSGSLVNRFFPLSFRVFLPFLLLSVGCHLFPVIAVKVTVDSIL